MSRKEVADYEKELKLKNQHEGSTDSDEILVERKILDHHAYKDTQFFWDDILKKRNLKKAFDPYI